MGIAWAVPFAPSVTWDLWPMRMRLVGPDYTTYDGVEWIVETYIGKETDYVAHQKTMA